MMRVDYIWFFALFVLLSSCQGPTFEAEFHPQNGLWTLDDTFSFSFEAEDTSTFYDFILHLQHESNYPYQNIYFQATTIFPNLDTVTDLFSINLADKYGRWNGDCNNSKCDVDLPLQENIRFRQIGTHQVFLQQYARQDTLPGIRSLSFLIYPHLSE